MCSIGDDNIDEGINNKYMETTVKVNPCNKLCIKCREVNAVLVLRNKDFYCQECFQSATVHKFKALLGKNKLIRPNEGVLVVLNIGHPSAALLHFIRTGLDLNTHKKLKFKPQFIFIDEFYHLNTEERRELLRSFEILVRKHNFEPLFANLINLINDDSNDLIQTSNSIKVNEQDGNLLEKFLNEQTVNKSQKIDYLNILKRQLLYKLAKKLNCKFIFTPELSADVATQLLSNISLGRGGQAPLDTSFCDSRHPEIKILRPLRLFDEDELFHYCKFNNLNAVTCRQEDKCENTIQGLVRKFVNDLQENYPATVTTVMKTGDKLGLVEGDKCELCQGPIEDRNDLCSAEATKYSHLLSIGEKSDFDIKLESFEKPQNHYCFACGKLFSQNKMKM